MERLDRQALAHENMTYFKSRWNENIVVDFVNDTKMYPKMSREDMSYDSSIKSSDDNSSIIEVVNGDSINVALEYNKLYENSCLKSNIAVLNMASDIYPGGGFLKGSIAQEEALCYRSALYMSLADPYNMSKKRKWKYPIPIFGAIHSPNIPIIRDSHGNFLEDDKQHSLNFISVSALRNPRLLNDGNHLTSNDVEITKEKIRTILRVGYLHGHKILILGAFGCGCYRNPSNHVAYLFRCVLDEHEFTCLFTRIVFAILDISNTYNYHVFKKYLIERANFDFDS